METTLAPAPAIRIDELGERIAADPQARFAISLDRLFYASDSYQLGFDLVRTYARGVADAPEPGPLTDDVSRLLHGLQILTGRARILGRRYGELAVDVRESGASLFDFQDDSLAREVITAIAAADTELGGRISERDARAKASAGTVRGSSHD
jgi:hypothetical protein